MVKTSSAADFEKVPRSRNYRMQQKSPHSNAVPCKVCGKGLTTEKALAIILYIILYVNLYIILYLHTRIAHDTTGK